jgi:glycosyltransferase involved in cell wall biosynthesis
MLFKCLQLSTESFSAFKFLLPLAQYLDETGRYETEIACNTDDYEDAASYSDQLITAGKTPHHIPIPRQISVLADLKGLWNLYVFLRDEKVDILHTHNSKAGIIGRLAGWAARVPVIVHSAYDYGPIYDHRGTLKGTLFRILEKIASYCSDKVLFITEDGVQSCLNLKIAPSSKLVNVGVGISFKEFNLSSVTYADRENMRAKFGLPSTIPIVGTLCRLVSHKGVDTIIKAAALVKRAEPNVHFLIAGGGPDEKLLNDLVHDLKLDGCVTFTGFIKDQSAVPVIFSLMDVFWLATKREGFGLVYTEANAMGVPVIGSNIPPVDFVIGDGIGGLLAECDSPESFADACIKLLHDPGLRRELATKGYDRGKQLFDERLTYERIDAVYELVLKNKCLA